MADVSTRTPLGRTVRRWNSLFMEPLTNCGEPLVTVRRSWTARPPAGGGSPLSPVSRVSVGYRRDGRQRGERAVGGVALQAVGATKPLA